MEGFGASGPQKALYEHFRITPERSAETGKQVAERAAAASKA